MKDGRDRGLLAKMARDAKIKHGRGACWVCGSVHGVKTSRMSYGTRCQKCIKAGKTNNDVILYQRWKQALKIEN